MQNTVPIRCPKCNNSHSFYRYGHDPSGLQKYLCRNCNHQFVPGKVPKLSFPKYPRCPVCGRASFLHHDHLHYSNLRCCDKKCNHSFFVPKPGSICVPSMSSLFGKSDFKRMRYPTHVIISTLTMFFLGKSSFRNISLILRTVFNVKVSHTTVGNWCRLFAPVFDSIRLELVAGLDFDSDEWHADETVVKVAGVRYYIWFIIDAETRFVLGFHLSPHRSSPQAFSLLDSVKKMGSPASIVTDRYAAYKIPAKAIFPEARHIRVASFKDDISNNVIEAFNHQFKAWYKTKQGFNSFSAANNLISVFVFFFNFVRPHSSLNGLTPAQVAGLSLSKAEKRRFPMVA